MSRKREKFLVLDVETANGLDDPLVYDIGFAVTDRYGNIYEKHSFTIYEIFVLEKEMMKTSYYAKKIPLYQKDINNKKSRLVKFSTARKIIIDTMKKHDITKVGAYNANFDRNALNTTMRFLTKSKYRYFFPFGVEFFCIWHMACQVLYTQTRFIKFCIENNFISETGNIQTSAEIGQRYITKNIDFVEEHRGLDDVLIEVQIMAKCYKQHKKMDKNINRLCWKIPQERKKQLLK